MAMFAVEVNAKFSRKGTVLVTADTLEAATEQVQTCIRTETMTVDDRKIQWEFGYKYEDGSLETSYMHSGSVADIDYCSECGREPPNDLAAWIGPWHDTSCSLFSDVPGY